MIKVLKKEEDEDSIISNKKNIYLTNLEDNTSSHNSKSKLFQKEFNDSYINKRLQRFSSPKHLLKCKMFHSIKSNNDNNNLLSPFNASNNFYNLNKNLFSSTQINQSINSQNMKSLEKDIQQKILNISIQIEKESSIIGLSNDNLKLSTLIKKKINIDNKDNVSIFSPKNKHKFQNSPKRNNNCDELDGNKEYVFKPVEDKKYVKKLTKKNKKNKHKFRILLRKKLVYDSFDCEEDEENEGIFISPDNIFIQIFDLIIIISSLFNIIYTPYFFSNIKLFYTNKNFVHNIYYFIDILYIFDLILGFFRAYHNYQFQIIKNNKEIIKHYLFSQFFLDFIQAIPFFSYLSFLCNKYKINNYEIYNISTSHLLLFLCSYLKELKFFKIIDIRKNYICYNIKQMVSKNDNYEKIYTFLIYSSLCIFGFYFFTSIHILIAFSSYPNWIINSGFQDENLFSLYLISFYYLITTMTTVGYGNIVCASSFIELFYQLILLSVGIIVYSWIVSNIGNYVKNESNASIRFDKDEAILEEIRILYPNMSYNLYKKIYHHLGLRKIRQKQCDSNILINSLPHSLKNEILLSMYKLTIKNFKIFKGIHNTDFTIRLLTNFIPLISKKNAFLIYEGQLIDNIIFIKEGRLALEASIDIKEPYKSIKDYLNKKFTDIYEDVVIVSDYENSFEVSKVTENNYTNIFHKAKNELNSLLNDKNKTVLDSSMNESTIIKEIGKWDFGGEIFEENNFQFINIINISKNESFGNVYMFLCKPSPLSLRVKSKIAELFLLRRSDASNISSRYPNIWAKYFQKSYKNMLSIKALTIKKIKYYWKNVRKKIHKKSKEIKNDISLEEEKKDNKIIRSIVPKKQKKPEVRQDCKSTFISKILEKTNNYNEISNTYILNKHSAQNSESLKYISFGKEIGKRVSNREKNCLSCFSPKKCRKEGEIKEEFKRILNTDCQKNKKLSTFNSNYNDNLKTKCLKTESNETINKNIQIKDIKKDYLDELNRKIKKLKASKNYYKNLCKKFKLNSINNNTSNKNKKINNQNNNKEVNDKSSSNSEKINNINININFNNNVILDKAEFNISKSSNNSNSSSYSKFNNNLSIESSISLTYQAKYKNLEEYTKCEYSKNRYLRRITEKFIEFYISIFSKNKKPKIPESNLSSINLLKNTNIDYGLKKIELNLNNSFSKNIFGNLKEGQYIIIFDKYNCSFNLLGKNKRNKRFSVSLSKTCDSINDKNKNNNMSNKELLTKKIEKEYKI